MNEEKFTRLEAEYVIKKNTPDIHFENVNEIVVIHKDGYTEVITEISFINHLIEALNNELIEDTSGRGQYPVYYTLNINGIEVPFHSFGDPYVGIGAFRIDDKFYVFQSTYQDSGSITHTIRNMFSLVDGSNEISYNPRDKVYSINDLFSNVIKKHGDYIVDNGDLAGAPGFSNGTNALYDFTTKQYQFTFLNKETMKDSVIVYNWIERSASLDSCEYNRNSDIYTNCSEYQQAWIQAALNAFLVSYGNYMDESDFLAQEDSFVFERRQ